MWDDMDKDVGEFVRQCLKCADHRAGNVVPRPMGDLVHGTEVGDVLYFVYPISGKSNAVCVAGLVKGGYGHLLVLMEGVSRFVWLEEAASCSTEVAARAI